jgi:hypothetical protein
MTDFSRLRVAVRARKPHAEKPVYQDLAVNKRKTQVEN